MKKNIIALLFLLPFTFLLFTFRVYSNEYVLPYPGPMPGNKLYKISRIVDQLQKYWYWGNIAQTRYHLELADKYLVEAKTLFEYKQYLLGVDALKRSDKEWREVMPYIKKAKEEGKDVRYLQERLRDASQVHQTVITQLFTLLPESFTWTPEKEAPTNLELRKLLEESLRERKNGIQ